MWETGNNDEQKLPKIKPELDVDRADIRNRIVDRAARYCLASILRPRFVELSEYEVQEQMGLRQDYSRVLKRWRQRLSELLQAGCPLLPPAQLGFGYHCPVSGTWVYPARKRPCGLRQLCPWCWSRFYVYDTFWRLKYALWGGDDNDGAGPPKLPCRVVDCVTTEVWSRFDSALETMFNRISLLRRTTLKQEVPDNFGAFQMFSVAPPSAKSDCWSLQERLLVLLPPKLPGPRQEPPAIDHPQLRNHYRRIFVSGRDGSALTQNQLAAPLGRVCRYPETLLYGDLTALRELLEYRDLSRKKVGRFEYPRGMRMSAYYGCLRNNAQRQRDAEIRRLRMEPSGE